eukprot:1161325-Pelagomonas_calceolata.AAC.16
MDSVHQHQTHLHADHPLMGEQGIDDGLDIPAVFESCSSHVNVCAAIDPIVAFPKSSSFTFKHKLHL